MEKLVFFDISLKHYWDKSHKLRPLLKMAIFFGGGYEFLDFNSAVKMIQWSDLTQNFFVENMGQKNIFGGFSADWLEFLATKPQMKF